MCRVFEADASLRGPAPWDEGPGATGEERAALAARARSSTLNLLKRSCSNPRVIAIPRNKETSVIQPQGAAIAHHLRDRPARNCRNVELSSRTGESGGSSRLAIG